MIIRNQIQMAGIPQRSTATPIQSQPTGLRRQAKPKIKPSAIAVYASVFALVIAMVSIGYHEPKKATVVANTANIGSTSQVDQTSVDNVVATNVAANAAQVVNLPVAAAVANLAISVNTISELAQSTDTSSALKPQIIDTGKANRFVTSYTVLAGDTVASVGAKFSITSATIKYANNLTSDALIAGTVLQILPVDGVLYTVKSGDTIDAIATKYKADKTRLVLYNDLDVSGLVPGSKIILPGGDLPTNERPGYIAPATTYYYSGVGSGFGGRTWYIKTGTPGYAGNTYYFGQCTRYAYDRRIELGLPVSSKWGDAYTWADNARSMNHLVVDRTPSVGAIIQNGGGFGHVAIVEAILPNGDLSISEMNARVAGGGTNIVSGRIILAGNVSSYAYIH